MESKHLILISVLTVAGCGGGGSSSPAPQQANTPAPPPIPAPASVSAKATSDGLVVDWAAVEGASDYNLYYATEKGLDISNYAAYQNGTLIPNIQPPQIISISNFKPVYHIVVSANSNDGEGLPSPLTIGVPRFIPSDNDPGLIVDRARGHDWKRCPHGMSYQQTTESCTGIAQRVGLSEAQAIANTEGLEVPTYEEMQSLAFCPSGNPGYFPYETQEKSCDGPTTLYAPIFPEPDTETDRYITRSYCSYDYDTGTQTMYTIQFGSFESSTCAGPPDALSVNLRLGIDLN